MTPHRLAPLPRLARLVLAAWTRVVRSTRYRPERRYMRGVARHAALALIGLPLLAGVAQASPSGELDAYDRLLAHAEGELRQALVKPGAGGQRLTTSLRGAEFAVTLAPEPVSRVAADREAFRRALSHCPAAAAPAATSRPRSEPESLAHDALGTLRGMRCAVAAASGDTHRGAWWGGRAEAALAFAFTVLRPARTPVML
ncbi:hypothetical protein [Muricoccus radiodurans]|uniref:hypothetical protein n=1 Tax=Muricoccus radiodurans TaxID=2231721 RepID=UPI003CF9CC54